MGQGLIGGVLWGVLAASAGLVVVSQVAAPPGQDNVTETAAQSPSVVPQTPVATTDPVDEQAPAAPVATPAPEATAAPEPAPPVPELAKAPPPDAAPALPAAEAALPAAEVPATQAAEQAPAETPKVATIQPDPALTESAALPKVSDAPGTESSSDAATDVAATTTAPGAKFVQAPPKPAGDAPAATAPVVDMAIPAAVVAALPQPLDMPTLPAAASAPATLPVATLTDAGPSPAPPQRPAANETATVVVTNAPPAPVAAPLSGDDQASGVPVPLLTTRAGFQPDLIAPAPAADAPPETGALPPPPPLTPEEMALAANAAALPAGSADPELPEIIVMTEASDPAAPSILRKPKPLTPTPSLTAKGQVPASEGLPKVGAALPSLQTAEAEVVPAANPAEDAPPIERFARPFDNAATKPLFSIVLIDTGGPQLDREALAAMPFPVTFVLDPTLAEAGLAASIYREAGQEVVMLATGLPEGATAADLEVSFGAHAGVLPEAVAVLDPETGGFQGDRPLSTMVVPVIKGQGRGLLSWDRGLNAAAQVAQREGLRSGVIFRRLDGEGEPKAQIRRYLDRAAFKAAQDGRVIVAGETRPDTVAALLEWAVEGRAATMALAPLSAALRVE